MKPPKSLEEQARRRLRAGLFDEIGEELDPAAMDRTVEMSKELLNDHSDAILGLVDNTDEAFRPRNVMGDLWTQFQEEIPTAKGKVLGEDDPDSYEIEDLVEPPEDSVIQNILAHGAEDGVEPDSFFVDLGALEELSDWKVATLEEVVPQPRHVPQNREVPAAERMKLVNQIVARSRKLAADTATPTPDELGSPPPPPRQAPRARFRSSHEVEEWQLVGVVDANLDRPATSLKPESTWGPLMVGLGLAAAAGWAYGTGVEFPVVVALAVGAAAMLLMGARSG